VKFAPQLHLITPPLHLGDNFSAFHCGIFIRPQFPLVALQVISPPFRSLTSVVVCATGTTVVVAVVAIIVVVASVGWWRLLSYT